MALTKEQIKKFKKLEEAAASYDYYRDEFQCSYGDLAETLYELGDKKWAKKIYKTAEDKINRYQLKQIFYINLASDLL